MIAPRPTVKKAPPLILGGGSRVEVLRLVADLSSRLAVWIERDHCNWEIGREERERTADLVHLLRSAAAAAGKLAR
jgi:alkanesulfonate monooxygenase SsuD/methylene tetrahydromethanopterin reductase-like flavin-dependent oxidoreductase (luciferase family)